MSSTLEITDLIAAAEEHGRRYVELFNAGDVETIETMYTEDAISVWEPGNPLTGQARRDSLAEFLAAGPTMTADLVESHVTRDAALLVVDWTISVPNPDGGEPEVLRGRGLDVLRRGADGRWLFAVDNPFGDGEVEAGAA
ncbi:nuclear transport factor 2 family protein [Actinosynnema sp. NPDC020468]|uniref:YybH family protein n=1 Tax=Actinosynnema sp. NPDC020468 TaxID=3154488 RepID=UPI0033C332FC